MRFVFRALLFLFVLVVLVVGTSFFLPRDYTVERTQVMQASAEDIRPWLDEPRRWKEWSVWFLRDPELAVEYSGPSRGEGSRMEWSSEASGTGSLTVTKSVPGKGVWFDLWMEAKEFGVEEGLSSQLTVSFEAAGDGAAGDGGADGETGGGTEVQWTHRGSFDQTVPLLRYMGLFADRMMGPDFQENLVNLDAKVSGKPAPAGSP